MNGLFAKLSVIELRARQGVCSGTCNTYHCYKVGALRFYYSFKVPRMTHACVSVGLK
jgi:hypothetical protein